jgi:deoxyribose-phosphate aldolase
MSGESSKAAGGLGGAAGTANAMISSTAAGSAASVAASAAAARDTARTALACLDLTSLNDADTDADIVALCERAKAVQARHGAVAALCVWPRFAALARRHLPSAIRVAAVANFPHGGTDVQAAVRDTQAILDAGAQEVDVVLPYRHLDAAPAVLQAVRRACEGLTLKVILETGELKDETLVRRAARLALDAGADFLKTSTGKMPVSATPQAAALLLQAIAADAAASPRVGFKPAGGIRTVADAAVYIALTAQHLGAAAVNPQRFRLGASGLLNDIEAVLEGRTAAGSAASY